MPIAVYPGGGLAGVSVREIVTNASAQVAASTAMHRRYRTPVVLSAMDLSVEAEAFGAEIVMSDGEIPTVVGRIVTTLNQAQSLRIPGVGEKRTQVYIDTVRLLGELPSKPLVLAGCIGPFSLAGRLAGVSETLGLTLEEPELVHALLERSTRFLTTYVQAFKAAGAHGVIMAEPGAGLLSPRGLSEFSSAYIKRIVSEVCQDGFSLILHNCAAKLLHLPSVLESGATGYHFGSPMDIAGALAKVPPGTMVCGNLDPSAVFCQSSPAEVAEKTRALIQATRSWSHFVISSGCDVPPLASMANLDSFFAAAAD